MSRLIEGSIEQGGRIVDDPWTALEASEDVVLAPTHVSIVVPLSVWLTERDALIARGTPLGVRLPPDTDPATVAADLPHWSLVEVEFLKFTDGRGYSIARLLRERHGYRGRLRAVGDVLRDQMFYLLRCGFDGFAMKHADHLESALSAYRDFSEAYQTSVDRKTPLFARRFGAVAVDAGRPAEGSTR